MMQPVRIAGRGLLTPLGVGTDPLSASLGNSTRTTGRIPEFRLADFIGSVKTYIDRTSALTLAACSLALKEAGWEERTTVPEVGLALGTQWGCMDSLKLFYDKARSAGPRLAPPIIFPHAYANAPVSLASIEFDLRGASLCVSSGLVSGALALAAALDALRLGHASRMLAGGVDSLSTVICEQSPEAFSEAAAIVAVELGSNVASGRGTIIEWAAARDTDPAQAACQALEACLNSAGRSVTHLRSIIVCNNSLEKCLREFSQKWKDKETFFLPDIVGDLMGAAAIAGPGRRPRCRWHP